MNVSTFPNIPTTNIAGNVIRIRNRAIFASLPISSSFESRPFKVILVSIETLETEERGVIVTGIFPSVTNDNDLCKYVLLSKDLEPFMFLYLP